MTIVNHETMFIERRTTSGKTLRKVLKGRIRKDENFRDWWLVPQNNCISLGVVTLPKNLVGNHVQFKLIIKPYPKREEVKNDTESISVE